MTTSEDMQGRPVATPLGQEELEDRLLQIIERQADAKPYGAAFRMRLASRRFVRRQLSGVGFFLELQVDGSAKLTDATSPLPEEVIVGDPNSGFYGGAIYFWSKDGSKPDFLETFSYIGEWPKDVSALRLSYAGEASL